MVSHRYGLVTPASQLYDLSASCYLRKCTALQYPYIGSQQLHIVYFEHLMQRAPALQTSVKLESRAARVVLLLLSFTSLLSDSASQALQASAGPQLNDSLTHSTGEAGSNVEVAGAEGRPAPKGSQHLASSDRVDSSSEIKCKGANHTISLVCQTTELFQVLVPPTADCCPAKNFLDESAHGKHSKPAGSPASSLLCCACQLP